MNTEDMSNLFSEDGKTQFLINDGDAGRYEVSEVVGSQPGVFEKGCKVREQDLVKILFLHGFYATGQCVPALALRDAFEGRAKVLTPDLPQHPREVLEQVCSVIDREKPDLLVGNSCGAFYAQMLAPVVGIPALLGNPHFKMTDFLKPRVGEHDYKSPRRDGRRRFIIDETLIEEFAELEAIQFSRCRLDFRDSVWGLFGEADTLAHFEPVFLEHYDHSFHFPGGHTPTAEEVRMWYVPLVERMLAAFPSKHV